MLLIELLQREGNVQRRLFKQTDLVTIKIFRLGRVDVQCTDYPVIPPDRKRARRAVTRFHRLFTPGPITGIVFKIVEDDTVPLSNCTPGRAKTVRIAFKRNVDITEITIVLSAESDGPDDFALVVNQSDPCKREAAEIDSDIADFLE